VQTRTEVDKGNGHDEFHDASLGKEEEMWKAVIYYIILYISEALERVKHHSNELLFMTLDCT